jgi:Tfp pilus assembly protein FimT
MTRKRQGFASIEYLVLLSIVVMLVAIGKPSPLERLISALQLAYQRFSFAMSLP